MKLNWLTSPKAYQAPDGAGGGTPAVVDDPGSPAGTLDAPAYEQETLGGYFRGRIAGIRSGELGNIPLFIGIIVIAIYFQSRNSNFLTAGNLVNLIVQMAPYAIIGMGVVFVLLLGEIDLSIGFVSGIGGVITALLLLPGPGQVDVFVAIAAAIAAGTAIGVLQGTLFAKVGIPSFIVTLAGLLGWNGVVLLLIGSRGTVTIQDDFIYGIANDSLSTGAPGSSSRAPSRCSRSSSSRRSAVGARPGCRTSR